MTRTFVCTSGAWPTRRQALLRSRPDDFDEDSHDSRIELAAGHRFHLGDSDVERECPAVCTVGAHGVPGVAAGNDPRLQRDVLTGKLVRIAPSVPALVMGAHDQPHVA